jgi:hypothetical protein
MIIKNIYPLLICFQKITISHFGILNQPWGELDYTDNLLSYLNHLNKEGSNKLTKLDSIGESILFIDK